MSETFLLGVILMLLVIAGFTAYPLVHRRWLRSTGRHRAVSPASGEQARLRPTAAPPSKSMRTEDATSQAEQLENQGQEKPPLAAAER